MRLRLTYLFFILTVLLSGCGGGAAMLALATPQAAIDGEQIKVLIASDLQKVTIKGATDGPKLQIEFASPGRARVNSFKKPMPMTLMPMHRFLFLNDEPYRGKLVVRSTDTGIEVINVLPLEDYLVGVINKEISSSWHKEAAKAQAVAARSYALYQMRKNTGRPYHVTSTLLDQVYSGRSAEDQNALYAVSKTKGEVLVYGRKLALALFHSNAGGRTEPAVDVWGGDYPYLISVKSVYDKEAPRYEWSFTLSSSELKALLVGAGMEIGSVEDIDIETTTKSGRVKKLSIIADGKKLSLSGEEIRRLVGYMKLRSTMFKVKRKRNSFVFKGNGAGHGVGMSQWGAKGMAEHGSTYEDILMHYYPGTKVEMLY